VEPNLQLYYLEKGYLFWHNLSQRLFLAQPFSKVVFGTTFLKGCFWDNLFEKLFLGQPF
jgi:hypothetical protein